MNGKPLTRELIADPGRYRLMMSLGERSLHVVAACTAGDEEAVADTVGLADDSARALEEAVYANPMLLLPFARTDVVAVTGRVHILPPSTAGCTDAVDALTGIFDDDRPVALADGIDTHTSALMLLQRERVNFIRRTFDRAAMHSHLAVLGRYLTRRSRLGNSGKVFVNLRADSLDILAFNSFGLAGANTFATSDDSDAAYYALAVARECGLAADADEFIISGDRRRRASVSETLRRFAPAVVPLIVPASAMAHLPKSANVPLELIVLPLCE